MVRSFANRTCENLPTAYATYATALATQTVSRASMETRMTSCMSNSGGGSGSNSCSSVPDSRLFVYSGVPIINYCNATNPSDPNFGRGCDVVISYNGVNYYRYYPMANSTLFTANYGCPGR